MWTTERIVTLVAGILSFVSLLVMTGAIYLVPSAFPVICVSVAVTWSLFVLVGSIFILKNKTTDKK